ncbi:MAG: hypothetical protein ChlgKO_13160 [Chlamydiales bacterium]
MKVTETADYLGYLNLPSVEGLSSRVHCVFQQVSNQTQATFARIEKQVQILHEEAEPAIAIISQMAKGAILAICLINIVEHTSNIIYNTEETDRLNEAYELARSTAKIAIILANFTAGKYLFSTTDLIISAYILSCSLYEGDYDKALPNLMHTGEHIINCAQLLTSFTPLFVVLFASKMLLQYGREHMEQQKT